MKRLLPLMMICTAILLAFLDGCSPHQVRTVGMAPTAPERYATPVDAVQERSADKWWLVFNDDALNDLMDAMFAGNLDVAQSVARLQQAMAIGRQRRAEQMPYLSLEGSAGRSQRLSAAGGEIGNAHGYSIAAGYELDLWNKIASRDRSQVLEIAASEEGLQALYLTLSARVAERYYLLVEQRAKLALIEQTIATRQDSLELVALRYREGMVSALDLYQARQNLANAKSQQPRVRALLETTSHALAVLTGGYPTAGLGGHLAELPDVPDTFPLGLPSDMLRQRPDIHAAMHRLVSADHLVAAAVADRWPTINLLADYGRSDSDFGTSISGTIWNLMGNLAMPLVDFGRRKAEVDRNEAVYAERLAAYRQTVLTAFQEVEDALVANRSAKSAIARLCVEAAAAEDALRLSRSEYKDGLSTYLPVLTAQTTHFDSQTRLLSARRELISARISLARALGGNWMSALAKERLDAMNHSSNKAQPLQQQKAHIPDTRHRHPSLDD